MKILLTGASRGIGKQIAIDLLKEGHEMVLHCNSGAENLKQLLKNNNTSKIISADLSNPEAVLDLYNKTLHFFGFPDVVINNAGIAESSPIEKNYSEWSSDFDKTININLKSPALICKSFILKKREDKIHKRFRIINVASRAAFRGEVEDFISYACSKGGLISLTKTITRSFGLKDNIVAFSIAPGFVNTDMAKTFIEKNGEELVKKGLKLDQLTEPKDISPTISLMVSGKMDHSTGSTIDINAGSYLR